MIDYSKLKNDMKKAARRAFSIRLQSGDGGNLSIRIPQKELLLIKASECSFGDMEDENIVLVDFKGNVVEGSYPPSREVLTHIEIYRTYRDVNAIFHSHSPWAVSVAEYSNELPPVSLPLNMKIGRVPVLDAGDNQANEEIISLLKDFLSKYADLKCFIQKRHGIFSLSKNIIKAEYNAELVEEASQIAVLSGIFKLLRERD